MPIKDKAGIPSLPTLFGIGYVILLGASVIYGVAYSLSWPLVGDASIFHYIAWRITQGAAPYRDIFDMNMPGIYLVHLLCLKLLGPTDLAFRLFDLGVCALCLLILGVALRRYSPLYAIAAGLFFVTYHISKGPADMLQRDFMIVPFFWLAAFMLIAILKQPGRWMHSLALGFCCGCMFWIKPVALAYAALCVVTILLWRQFAFSARVMAVAWIGAGWLIPALMMNIWLYIHGGLPAFYVTFFYFTVPVFGAMNELFSGLQGIALLVIDILLAGALLFVLFKYTVLEKAEKMTLCISLIYGLIHFYAQGKGFNYHTYPFWGACTLYFGIALPKLTFKNGYDSASIYALVLFLCITFSPFDAMSRFAQKNYRQELTGYQQDMEQNISAALAHVPKPILSQYNSALADQHIQFFDFTYAQLWNMAYRLHWVPVSRHIYPFPFYSTPSNAYLQSLGSELYAELLHKPPLLIIVSLESLPFHDGRVYHEIETREPWRSFFEKRYTLTATTQRYRIYARIE